jgi:copper chaperone CopZ
MRNGWTWLAALPAVAVLVLAVAAQPPQPAATKITLTELHCKGCLKRVSTQLLGVPGVGGVQGDLTTATLQVAHKPGTTPSPRAMWEAVLQADHTPTRLEGPSGVFTAKPQF